MRASLLIVPALLAPHATIFAQNIDVKTTVSTRANPIAVPASCSAVGLVKGNYFVETEVVRAVGYCRGADVMMLVRTTNTGGGDMQSDVGVLCPIGSFSSVAIGDAMCALATVTVPQLQRSIESYADSLSAQGSLVKTLQADVAALKSKPAQAKK
jgi:hypothetical protein